MCLWNCTGNYALIFIYKVFESYMGVNESLINTFVIQTILVLLCFYLLF